MQTLGDEITSSLSWFGSTISLPKGGPMTVFASPDAPDFVTTTTRLNNTGNCLTGASLTSKLYTETIFPLTCQVCRVWRTECCPAYPQCCRSWSSQASPHPPEIVLDYQPTVLPMPVKHFLKPLPANKRQIRPTKFQDFTAKYRQASNPELQTLLSPPLKYQTAQELCFCLHHHWLAPPQWRPGEGPHAWGQIATPSII